MRIRQFKIGSEGIDLHRGIIVSKDTNGLQSLQTLEQASQRQERLGSIFSPSGRISI